MMSLNFFSLVCQKKNSASGLASKKKTKYLSDGELKEAKKGTSADMILRSVWITGVWCHNWLANMQKQPTTAINAAKLSML